MKLRPQLLLLLALVWAVVGTGMGYADGGDASAAAALGARYRGLQVQLGHSQFQRPLYLESSENADGVVGDAYALIEFPFATTAVALKTPANWCDILLLHLNIKYCRVGGDANGVVLRVDVGTKQDQPLADAFPVSFAYRVVAATPDYLKVILAADQGPLGTHDYRVALELIPVAGGRTFVHFTYAYAYGLAGRLALQAYFGTLGRDKVGFTVTGEQADGSPLNIGGMRGLVERNTMRYYLAIEAFLGALAAPPLLRQEKSLRDWFAASERYPRQLHEMDQTEYLDMKHKEFLRAASEPRTP